MKKKLLLGAVVLSMAMAFTACGSASSTGSEETTVAAEEETVAEDATEEETVGEDESASTISARFPGTREPTSP